MDCIGVWGRLLCGDDGSPAEARDSSGPRVLGVTGINCGRREALISLEIRASEVNLEEHIMTASMRPVYEGYGSGHFTVDGADDDLWKALTIGSDGVHRECSRALSVASRAGVSLNTRDKCGLGQLRPATDGTGPGERQRRRGGELRRWNE